MPVVPMLAVVGVGRWGLNYLRTLEKIDADVKWIFSRNKSRMDEVLKLVSTGARPAKDYDEILNDPAITGIIISSSASSHGYLANRAISAGKNVLIEKPFTLDSKEALGLAEVAKEKNVVLMCGHIHRYNPAFQKLRSDIDSGVFGKVSFFHSIATSSGPKRDDMDVVFDFLPHEITILHFLTGSYPVSVFAAGKSFAASKIDEADVVFEFADASAACFISWDYPVKQRKLTIIGRRLLAEYDDYSKILRYSDGKVFDFSACRSPLEAEVLHFIDCIENKREPLTGGFDGAKSIAVIECVEKSISSGKPVKA